MEQETIKVMKEIYEKLSAPLPKEAVQRSKGSETKKGYDTTGYGYQYVVNRFNEVLGLGGWGWKFEEIERQQGRFKSGQPYYEITTKVSVWIEILGKKIIHSETGGHRASSLADALKGASTNGLKKTAAFFGVGRQAFEKSIDEDNQEQEEIMVETPTGKKVSIHAIIKKMKELTNIKELEENKEKIKASEIYTDVQKNVVVRAINEKITELKNNV